MARADLKILTPPALLSGVVVLLWGFATGNAIPAAVLALVLEGRRWIPIEWDFDEEGQSQAFYMSVLLMAAAMVLSWVLDEESAASFNVMLWMPFLFLPLEFVQRYGKRDFVVLNTFFFLTKRRLDLDRKEGREVAPMEINTGYPYILITLISACCVEKEVTHLWAWFCIAFLLLIFSVARARGMRPWGMLLVMPIVFALSWGGTQVLESAHEWAERHFRNRNFIQSSSTRTTSFMSQIGELGKVQLSPQIEWRVWSDEHPQYLRLASYNNYNQRRWSYSYVQEGFDGWFESFKKHEKYVVNLDSGETTYFRKKDEAQVRAMDPDGGALIRGTITHTDPSAVVPTLNQFMAISDIPGGVTFAEVNSMGTMRLVDRGAVINYRLHLDPDEEPQDKLPVEGIDLKIPEAEQAVVREFARKLGLHELESEKEVVQAIISYFGREFTYSTDFDPGEFDYQTTHLDWFLNDVKCGHCEYYATAATLLLRECGIAARYTTGYSVNERSGDRWNVRGTNAHAWTRAFIDGKWINVDATPADLRGVAEQKVTVVDWVRERIAMLREDFFIWRQSEENKSALLQRGGIVVGLLVLWIFFRLWQHRSKEVSPETLGAGWDGEKVITPLHGLQRALARTVGAREGGETLSQWLRRAVQEEMLDDETVERAIVLHQKMRFDPVAKADVQPELKELAAAMKKQLKTQKRKP